MGVLLALTLGALLTWRQAVLAEHSAATANAHLEAMLNVLSAASPDVYAGREPRASEFLIEAARRLEARFSDDPALIWSSLSQIGIGLMNLNHFAEAEVLLQRALAALDQVEPRDLERELDTLRYVVTAQRGFASAAQISSVGDRIAQVAAEMDAPAGAAINALASAANSLSRVGDLGRAYQWLERAEQLRLTAPQLPASVLENYWRQRGWTALRGLDIETAEAAVRASLEVIDGEPSQFSALRRAEAEILLAQTSLLRHDGAGALAFLAKARDAVAAEYPPAHLEQSMFMVLEARALLESNQAARALKVIEVAAAQLTDAASGTSEISIVDDAHVANAVLAHAYAAARRRADARLALAKAQPAPVLANRRSWTRAAGMLARYCA